MSMEWTKDRDIRDYIAARRRKRQRQELLLMGLSVAVVLVALRVLG